MIMIILIILNYKNNDNIENNDNDNNINNIIKNKNDIFDNDEENNLKTLNNIKNNKFDNKTLHLINTEDMIIKPDFNNNESKNNKELTPKEKIEKFAFLICSSQKEEFFNRLVLNYLHKNNVNLNDEELISLLKLGQNNNYQRILNKSLKLNLTKDQNLDKNISFKEWVKKFIKNKNDLKDKEKLLNQYNDYIKQQNNKKNNNNEEDNEKNEEDDINNTKKINDIDIDLTDNKMKNNFYLGKNEEIKNNDNLEKNLQSIKKHKCKTFK